MAMGALTCLWMEAQKYFLTSGEIPFEAWEQSGLPEYLITTGWAERTLTGVQAKGQNTQFAWLKQASEAGKASAKSRKTSKTVAPRVTPVEHPLNERGTSYSFSSSIKKEETTTAEQIKIAFEVWNETLEHFEIPSKNISPPDERTLSQAIKALGIDRVLNSLKGKRYEGGKDYDPKKTLSLDYCLSRNSKGVAHHERLENLYLAESQKQSTSMTEAEADRKARGE